MNPHDLIQRILDGTLTRDDEDELHAYAAMMGLTQPSTSRIVEFARLTLPYAVFKCWAGDNTLGERHLRGRSKGRWHDEYLYVIALHMRETLNG